MEVRFTTTKVVGIGDVGIRVVKYLTEQPLSGIDFITINTHNEHQTLTGLALDLLINNELANAPVSSHNPELAQQAAEENVESLVRILSGADTVFIVCALGGGTGTGIAHVVARIARELGATIVAVVTTPFTFEGSHRLIPARATLQLLRNETDSLIVIENDRLFSLIPHSWNGGPIDQLFAFAFRMFTSHVLVHLYGDQVRV